METYGEWSKVEQLKRNTGNKSKDSEENFSIEAGLNVKMLHFSSQFQSWRPYVVETDKRSIILHDFYIFPSYLCLETSWPLETYC